MTAAFRKSCKGQTSDAIVTGVARRTISFRVERADHLSGERVAGPAGFRRPFCVTLSLPTAMKYMIRSISPAKDPQDPPIAAPAADQCTPLGKKA
jgi:hypothetical protein